MAECKSLVLVYHYDICSGYIGNWEWITYALSNTSNLVVTLFKQCSWLLLNMIVRVSTLFAWSMHLWALWILPIAPLTNLKVTSILRRSITLQPTLTVITFSRRAVWVESSGYFVNLCLTFCKRVAKQSMLSSATIFYCSLVRHFSTSALMWSHVCLDGRRDTMSSGSSTSLVTSSIIRPLTDSLVRVIRQLDNNLISGVESVSNQALPSNCVNSPCSFCLMLIVSSS